MIYVNWCLNGLYIDKINSECFCVCQLTKPLSPFRKLDASKCSSFQWKVLVEDISQKAPTLLKIFSSIITSNDKRKQSAATSSHHPGLCMAVAILLKEKNREMCGLQSIISLLLYSSHVDKEVCNNMIKNKINVMHIHQVYSRMNHVGVCMSYTATLNLLNEVSKLHTTPLKQWIADDVLFKFWGDNVDKKKGVRDV